MSAIVRRGKLQQPQGARDITQEHSFHICSFASGLRIPCIFVPRVIEPILASPPYPDSSTSRSLGHEPKPRLLAPMQQKRAESFEHCLPSTWLRHWQKILLKSEQPTPQWVFCWVFGYDQLNFPLVKSSRKSANYGVCNENKTKIGNPTQMLLLLVAQYNPPKAGC